LPSREISSRSFSFSCSNSRILFSAGDRFPNFFVRVPGDYVLLAIPIEGFNSNYGYPLGERLVFRIANFIDPLSCLLALEDLNATQDFET
jgi:hypothetical protein